MYTNLIVVVLSLLVTIAYTKDISLEGTPIPCSWTNPETGDQFDMSSLSNNITDYKMNYDTTDPKKLIWINLCRPLVNTLCGTTVAGCQQWDPTNNNGKATIAIANTLQFSWGTQSIGGEGLIATLTGGTMSNGIPRNMEIDFVCTIGQTSPPVYISEIKTTLTYVFEWKTEYACPVSSCQDFTYCTSCTTAGCTWCLESSSCENEQPCHNFIKNPKYCPTNPCTLFQSCESCTSQNSSCDWCLDSNSCIPISEQDSCSNVINWPQYCPASKGKSKQVINMN